MFFCCSLLQGCIKRPISEPHGTTDPDVRRLGGPYANSSVPHEQCHHGVGFQKHVQWTTNCSQLSGETFIEVSFHKVIETSHVSAQSRFKLKRLACFLIQQRSTRRHMCGRNLHSTSPDRHSRVRSDWNGGDRGAVERKPRFKHL